MEICRTQIYIHSTYICIACTVCLHSTVYRSIWYSECSSLYTLQMTTLQQCLKFCYRELYIQHVCIFSVTAQASSVWTVAYVSCLPKDAWLSLALFPDVLHNKVLCAVQYLQEWSGLRLNMLYYHQVVVVTICCVVSLAYNIDLWCPPRLSLYSVCLCVCLSVHTAIRRNGHHLDWICCTFTKYSNFHYAELWL